jgi:pyruvate-formate lyase-activating enzyme
VSGGEATTQLPFLIALFTAIKTDPALHHLTCLVDSNGLLSETGWQNCCRYWMVRCWISKPGETSITAS